jgi:RNA polymerase sigma-B factor
MSTQTTTDEPRVSAAGTVRARRREADSNHRAATLRGRRAEESALFARLARERTPAARDAIVERFMPLARQLARRYAGAAESDDLEQVAAIGLVKAIDRYDAGRGLAFSSYAVPTIAGEIKRHLRDHAWTVRVPRELQESSLRLDRATEELTAQLGRAPTAAELAKRVGSTVEEVLEARQTVTARRPVSLDQPVNGDEGAETLGALIGIEESAFETAEQAALLGTLMRDLTYRDRLILHLRFVEDRTQSEIGEQVGLSQMQVSRVLRAALSQLQAAAH